MLAPTAERHLKIERAPLVVPSGWIILAGAAFSWALVIGLGYAAWMVAHWMFSLV